MRHTQTRAYLRLHLSVWAIKSARHLCTCTTTSKDMQQVPSTRQRALGSKYKAPSISYIIRCTILRLSRPPSLDHASLTAHAQPTKLTAAATATTGVASAAATMLCSIASLRGLGAAVDPVTAVTPATYVSAASTVTACAHSCVREGDSSALLDPSVDCLARHLVHTTPATTIYMKQNECQYHQATRLSRQSGKS